MAPCVNTIAAMKERRLPPPSARQPVPLTAQLLRSNLRVNLFTDLRPSDSECKALGRLNFRQSIDSVGLFKSSASAIASALAFPVLSA